MSRLNDAMGAGQGRTPKKTLLAEALTGEPNLDKDTIETMVGMLMQDRLYSQVADLENAEIRLQAALGNMGSRATELESARVYKGLEYAILTFMNNNYVKSVRDKRGVVDYIREIVSERDPPEPIDEKKLKEGYGLAYAHNGKRTCESVTVLLDMVKQYNKLIDDLKEREGLEERVRAIPLKIEEKRKMIDPEHKRTPYKVWKEFDALFNLDSYDPQDLSEEQLELVKHAMASFMVHNRKLRKPVVPASAEPSEDITDSLEEDYVPIQEEPLPQIRKVEKISMRSNTNPGVKHYIAKVTDLRDGSIDYACSCKGYQIRKDCRHVKELRAEEQSYKQPELILNLW